MSTPLNSRIAALLNGPLKGQGWCTPEKGNDLALAIIKTRASVIVEVGVFFGSSLLPMALACKEQEHGVVWAIDPWSREAGIDGYEGKNLEWWGALNYESIHQTFLAHLKAQEVEPYVKVVRARSDDIEPPEKIDVFHCDGQHTDQATRDVERYASRVVPGGFVFMDDISGWNGAPARAVEKLLTLGFKEIFQRDTGAMFQREMPKVLAKKKPLKPVKETSSQPVKKVPKKRGRPAGSKNKAVAAPEPVAV